MLGWFGRKQDEKPLPEERGPLAVAIGGALDVDFLSLEALALGGQPGLPLPVSGPFIVSAFGEAQLDAASVLSRYYDDEHRMIQVMSGSGKPGDAVEDISFYQPWDSVVPASRGEWARWTGPTGVLGEIEYDADGILFRRFWGEGDGRAPLVEFTERVHDGDVVRSIHQTCMLYFRPIGQTREMLLINVERDLGQAQSRAGSSVEFLLGYGLEASDVRRV